MKFAWFAVIVSASCLLIPVLAEECSAEPVGISVSQQGFEATLSVDAGPGDSVIWDLGDGRVISGLSVSQTWGPGLYTVKAYLVSSDGDVRVFQRYIGFYNDVPPTSVARNQEYNYGVFIGSDPKILVFDSTGKKVTWLSYDSDRRVVTGVTQESGSYFVYMGAKSWRIDVYQSSLSDPWVKFDAEVSQGTVTAFPTGYTQDSVARYSWSLSTIDGDLVSIYEGRNLSMATEPGFYVLKLQQVGLSGSASYSQVVEIVTEPEPEPYEPDEPISIWPIALGAASAVLLLASAANRSIWPAGAALLCAVVAILMVIKWI